MRYKPSDSEVLEIDTFSAEQRLHYFLSRAVESEEVWGLGDDAGWVLKDVDDKTIIPIWPYEALATACSQVASTQTAFSKTSAMAVSLEQFVYSLLPQINHQNIQIEILPTKILPGKIMQARDLSAILEGLMESGEYYMEG